VQILNTLTDETALFVENKRLLEEWSQQLSQRNILLELAKAVNSNRELPDLLTYIVKTAAEILNAEASSLLLREEDLLRFEVAYGEMAGEIKKFTVPIGTGIAGTVALSGKSTRINDSDKEPGILKDIDNKTGFKTRNLLCVPLQVGERVIGVLEVVNRRDEGGFSEGDVSLIEGFSSQAAVAIERAQLVERRIHGERLEAIGRTVTGLTHCIKNITNVLKAGVYIVDRGFGNEDMEAVRKGWNITKSGCERITELVLDMLTLSKKREPEYEECDPCLIAAEVVELIKAKAEEKNIEVQTALDKETGIVRVDRKGIFRCLMNLVSNAIDACDGTGGIVRIETFPVREKRSFGFRIIDNGHGIKKEDQKKLFHEFFSTKGSKGTGLGLSVTHSIISEHGGNIRCDSQVGRGTTFTIELPTGR
jgi:signal transduction histidine kinase